MVDDIRNVILLENRLSDLFFRVSSQMEGSYRSIILFRDNDFERRRDRSANDIHAFFELYNDEYFHLRGYTRHMLQFPDMINEDKVFLTGYHKKSISHTGGTHSFKQRWYHHDARIIADEILMQNTRLFE